MTESEGRKPPEQTPRRPRRRWLRISLVLLLVPVALFGLSMVLMRQSWVVAPLLRPILAEQLGGEIEIGAARVEGSNSVSLRDVIVRSRAHEGEAAEIARIGSIRVGTNLIGLLFGRTEPLTIELDGAVFRISEDFDRPGEFSFMGLEREDDDDDDDSEAQPLTLLLRGGRLEVGTHRGARFTPGSELPIAGTIESAGAEEEWFKFELWETVAGGREIPDEPLRIKGRINIETQALEGRIDGLVFDERLRGLCPQLVQAWWGALDPEGAVRDARLEMDGQGGLAASINVKDVALTIPIEREDVWRRYALGTDDAPAGLPRMRVQSGRVELHDGILTLDNLSGVLLSSERTRNLAEVPYHVNGSFGSRDAVFDWKDREQWVDHLLHFAPINLSFVMEDFQFDGTPGSRNSAVELPAAITRVLEQFSMESCSLDTSVTITREEATRGAGGQLVEREILTSGRAKLSEGRGAYAKFPYPLEDVSAELRFDSHQVVVESLLARGPNGGRISIGGSIHPPTKWPNVDLHISGVGMPVDDHLRTALPEKYRIVLDALRHRESFDALAAAGALPTVESLEQARQESLRLIEERQSMAAEDGGAQQLAALDRRIAALDLVTQQGEFTLGGSINMEIDIDRVEGQGEKTFTTGRIEIFDGGLVLDHFPYPFWVESGILRLERGRVLIEDWVGHASGGGRVYVRGAVETPTVDGRTRVRPDLEIGVFDDRTNPALTRAIALAGRGDPSNPGETEQALARAAELLEESGLDAMLSLEGGVTTAEDGDVEWNFAVALDDGSAVPSDAAAGRMRELGLFWPAGLAVDRVTGSLAVSHESVRIARIDARRGDGALALAGEISMEAGEPSMRFQVDFTGFALEPYLLSFVAPTARERAKELWDRWQPQGAFDAQLAYHSQSDEANHEAPLTVNIWPRDLSLLIDGARLELSGLATADDPAVLMSGHDRLQFRNVRFALGSAETNDGILDLTGELGGEAPQLLRGTLAGGRFESPWLQEFYILGEADRWSEWVGQFSPRGSFDADFELVSTDEQAARFTATVRPQTLSFLFNDVLVNAALAPGGAVHVGPGRVTLNELSGRLGTGAVFALAGEIDTADLLDAQLLVSYEGGVYDPEATAFVPAALLAGLKEIEFETAEPLRFTNAHVRLRQVRNRESGDSDVWRRSFRGTVLIDDAAFEAGVGFDGARGRLHVEAEAQGGRPARAQVAISLDRMFARGRRLNDVSGLLVLSDDGERLLLPELSASCYGGMATASAIVGLGEGAPYEARVDLASVNLRGFSRARQAPEQGAQEIPAPAGNTEGTLFASISLEGYRGAPEQRRGRGSIEVVDGTLASNPVTLPLMQLSQLMLPLDASLSYGEASFYILGDRAIVEQFILESDRMILMGEGAVGLDDFELDLRLRSRGRVVGLSDVVGVLSDQLYGIAVRGPLASPEASIVPVPTLTGLFRPAERQVPPPAMRRGPAILAPQRAHDASAAASGDEIEQ